jgi:hypothetical protein
MESIYDDNFKIDDKIIGLITIRPLKVGEIGKTFINPYKIKNSNFFIRTTNFQFGMIGRKFYIESFPFSSQDGEYMTCAQTSLWNILQYYGTRYKEYKVALPHEIVEIVDKNHFARVLPSSGLNYTQSSAVLKKFGFSSQIYYRFNGDTCIYNPDNQFKRLFHYYVESGIPLMTGIKLKSNEKENGHAAVCIGHGKIEIKEDAESTFIGRYSVLNSADFVQEYIYMDDNKYPYYKAEYDKFDYPYNETKIKYFIAPLYKRILLDAFEAEKIFYELLKNKYFGLNNLENIDDKIVISIFLSTARNYKASRFESVDNSVAKRLYINIPLPKFVWVCEISTLNEYKNNKIIGEIVLDATASKYDKLESTILIRYQQKFGFKLNNETMLNLKERLINKRGIFSQSYSMFDKNLKEIKNV